jgi:hypothetical protein
MKDNEKNTIKAIGDTDQVHPLCSGRDPKGRFIKGNKIATDVHITGVRSIDIRKHRAFINDHIPQLLQMLIDEALTNKNIQVAMWLVNKIIPDVKAATFIHSCVVNGMTTLGELKDQSAHTLKETVEGEWSLEAASMLINLYQIHKQLIEAADIEPLIQDFAKRLEIGGIKPS